MRPQLDIPQNYTLAPQPIDPLTQSELATADWRTLFNDPILTELIDRALAKNNQLAAASDRIEEFRALAGIARAEYFPDLAGNGRLERLRRSTGSAASVTGDVIPQGSSRTVSAFSASASLFYELDFWGRIRRSNEATRAELLSTEFARHTIMSDLVQSVAQTYFELRELDYELEISRRTRDSRGSSLKLAVSRSEQGVASKLDVYQAEVLVRSADIAIVQIEQAVAQREHLLAVLLGETPGPIARGKTLPELTVSGGIPSDLPSSLLERRPDIRQAEENLVAANARIGVAKAMFFPEVSLTGLFGYQSSELSDLFDASSRGWNFGPSISIPIFTGWRLSFNLEAAKAREAQALENYKGVIVQAFREVSDSLVAYQKVRELRKHQEALVQSLRGVTGLSHERYRGGVSNYLEVLDAERQLFDAERALAAVQRDELISVVTLYKALGGGWQPEPNGE